MEPSDLVEFLQTLTFKSNPNLRPAGTQLSYTKEMVDEYIKCKKDPLYFIENYVKVVHPDRGVVLMELYEYQKRMITSYHQERYTIARTARQQGKTTTAAAYFIWYMIFNDNRSIAILANKQATADEIMSRVRFAYENLPKWLQQGVRVFNRRSIELENGTKTFCAATSSSGIRGKTINLLYIDELAFIQNTQADDFFTSVYPTITASKDSKVILTSTPNGFNHFYKFWNDAEKKLNGFNPIRVHWYETPGRDQAWYNAQKAILGELKASQELEAEFLGSSLQLLTPSTMSKLTYDIPEQTFDGEYTGLKIYKMPEKGRQYVMTVDVSRGRHLDSSTFLVINVSEYPHRIAASYSNNEIAPMMYANILQKIARQYNEAYILVEINDVGAQVANDLYYEFEYEELFWTKAGDVLGKRGVDPYPGIRTTKKTKRIGCANLKDIVEKEQFIINDYQLISELSTFVQSLTSGSYEADEGFHDDMVMCAVLFGWLVTQPWFKDLTNKDMRMKMYNSAISKIEEDLAPIGWRIDGTEAEEAVLNW